MNYPETIDLTSLIPSDYRNALSEKVIQNTQGRLQDALKRARLEKRMVFPSYDKFLSCLDICRYEDVKVVILGQDPYHSNEKQANGIAFSVSDGVALPPSLRNIYKEVKDCYATAECDIRKWLSQGVMMLNASLTVCQGQPGSHMEVWQEFTDELIRVVQAKGNIVFCMWGNFAINKCVLVTNNTNIVLKSSHPSPFSASKTESPFLGSRVFKIVNEKLRDRGLKEIEW